MENSFKFLRIIIIVFKLLQNSWNSFFSYKYPISSNIELQTLRKTKFVSTYFLYFKTTRTTYDKTLIKFSMWQCIKNCAFGLFLPDINTFKDIYEKKTNKYFKCLLYENSFIY